MFSFCLTLLHSGRSECNGVNSDFLKGLVTKLYKTENFLFLIPADLHFENDEVTGLSRGT